MKSKLICLSMAIVFGFAWFASSAPAIAATETLPGGFSFTAAGDYAATTNTTSVLGLIKVLKPSFNLGLGDLSYKQRSDTGWCDFVKSGLQPAAGSSDARVPFILLAGNHESDASDGDIDNIKQCLPFSQLFPDAPTPSGVYAEQYYFDYPKVNPVARFIMASPDLDFKNGRRYDYTIRNKGTANEIKGAGYAYVEARIAEAKAQNIPWVIVGIHKVCVTTGAKDCEIGADFANMLIEKGVNLVLAGHVHSYERTYPLKRMMPNQAPQAGWIGSQDPSTYDVTQGTIFNTIGTGGKEISNQNNSDSEKGYFATRYGGSNPHFGAGEFVLNATELRGKFIDAKTGAVIDSFKITKALVPASVAAAPAVAATVAQSTTTSTSSTSTPATVAASAQQTVSLPTQATASCVNLAVNMRYEKSYSRTGRTMTDANTGGAVTLLQNFLSAKGYLKATPNGQFGPATRDAVSAFQAEYNIPANPKGYVGPMTREKIRDVSCGLGGGASSGAAKSITVSSPAGNRADNYVAGSQIRVAINNPVANPTRSASGMSYTVDLTKGDSVIQRFGTVYVTSETPKFETTFMIASGLERSADYKVKVTPSCTSLADVRCRQAFSNSFIIYSNRDNPLRRNEPVIEIVSPNTGTIATGTALSMRVSIPSDKVYTVSYYLVPLAGAAVSGNGTYYDPVSGGYSLGGVTPSSAIAEVNGSVMIPNDIPYGTYKIRAYLRNASETSGSPTIWTALAYDDSGAITVGSQNSGGTSTGTSSSTSPVSLRIISPAGDESWKIGSAVQVKVAATHVPAGAHAVIRLSGGAVMLSTPNLPASGVFGFTVPMQAMIGDIMQNLQPGKYNVSVTIYDKAPCIGLCAAQAVPAQILASATSAGTVEIKQSSDPYFKVLAPAAGYVYSSSSPDMTVRWEWRNLPVNEFKVELGNKLVDSHLKTVADGIDKNVNSATFRITDAMIQKFVEKSGGKTRDQLKASYYLKITATGRGIYFTPKALEGASGVFTVNSTVAQ